MERRVLIHAPRGRDAAVVKGVVEGIDLVALVCHSADELMSRLSEGGAAAIVTEESLLQVPEAPLRAISDFPDLQAA